VRSRTNAKHLVARQVQAEVVLGVRHKLVMVPNSGLRALRSHARPLCRMLS